MIKRLDKNAKIALALLLLCALAVFLLDWYSDDPLPWLEMKELRAVDVYRPGGTDKFGSAFLYTIDDGETLAQLKALFNSVEHSSGIQQIPIDDAVFDAQYTAALDIRPIYTTCIDGEEEATDRLLHLFLEDAAGDSYLIVVGTGRGYRFDAEYTKRFVGLLA